MSSPASNAVISPATLPLLGYSDLQAPLLRHTGLGHDGLRHDGQIVSRGDFVQLSLGLAAQLPDARFAINLCQNRYYFMLGFAAACLRKQTNLLPASQASGALQTIAAEFPQHHLMDDASIAQHLSSVATPLLGSTFVPHIAADHVAAICFTSGSTGKPQAHPSTWGTLVASAKRSAAGIFGQQEHQRGRSSTLNIVATVPPQHMFGLETSILQPLVNNCTVYTGKPFFPADVHNALQGVPTPRALVITPTHLRACVIALPTVPAIEFVLSATAPLPPALATQAEAAWQTRVLEIYGSTETGAIATRRTTEGDTWTLLPGGSLSQTNSATQYRPDNTTQTITLHDGLRCVDEYRFVLTGRSTDLIKVAGKRASLTELNARLLAIPGVLDGVVFQPEADHRVAALVVAEAIGEREILSALSAYIDEVFLPRPLRLVKSLPRNAVGKLPLEALLQALK